MNDYPRYTPPEWIVFEDRAALPYANSRLESCLTIRNGNTSPSLDRNEPLAAWLGSAGWRTCGRGVILTFEHVAPPDDAFRYTHLRFRPHVSAWFCMENQVFPKP